MRCILALRGCGAPVVMFPQEMRNEKRRDAARKVVKLRTTRFSSQHFLVLQRISNMKIGVNDALQLDERQTAQTNVHEPACSGWFGESADSTNPSSAER